MDPDDFPAPTDGFVLTHFLVVSDQERSRAFYQSLFDGQVLLERDPVIMKVADSWIILNVGGEPTVDKPTVTLTTPAYPNHTSAFSQCPGPRHPEGVQRVVGKGRGVPHRAEGRRRRDPCRRP